MILTAVSKPGGGSCWQQGWPEADLVVVAPWGSAVFPTLAALGGKDCRLANKKCSSLGRAAGPWGVSSGRSHAGQQHSAIWQCLGGRSSDQVRRIWLTASGGPFLHQDAEHLSRVTPEDALAHPTWKMGPKISVDSATMMNKGLEVIEAHWLFGVPLEQISVAIHPQSIVHSAVEFIDGTMMAQLGPPDMRLPIQYALSYPGRKATPWPRLDLFAQELTFTAPDREKFPCLELAYRALQAGGTMPACLTQPTRWRWNNFSGQPRIY